MCVRRHADPLFSSSHSSKTRLKKNASHPRHHKIIPSNAAQDLPWSHRTLTAVILILKRPPHPPPYAKRLFFPLRPHARLEAAAQTSPQPSRSPIPAARHPSRRVLLHALDDIAPLADPPHARRHESSALERLCAHGRGRRGGERGDGSSGPIQ